MIREEGFDPFPFIFANYNFTLSLEDRVIIQIRLKDG